MKFIRVLHTGMGLLGFSLAFLILLIPLLIPIFFPGKFRWIGKINRLWARATFVSCFIPHKAECVSPLDRSKNYIFCPNHFSYLDIPSMGLNPVDTIFVGKSDVENIPLFGWMYRNLHITFNRARLKDKYDTIVRSRQAIDEGKSLVIYPEGGIFSTNPPEMVPFKDGAFRLAIEKQIPIVPVTIPRNWIILPPDEFLLNWGKVKVIFHEPIETTGMSIQDIDSLKERTFDVIRKELKRYGNQGHTA